MLYLSWPGFSNFPIKTASESRRQVHSTAQQGRRELSIPVKPASSPGTLSQQD